MLRHSRRIVFTWTDSVYIIPERFGVTVSEENKKEEINGEGAIDNADAAVSEQLDGGQNTAPAPEIKKEKERKKISVSAFIYSAVALVLAAVMITFSCCSIFYKKQLAQARLENITLGSSGKYNELELIGILLDNYSYFDLNEQEMMDKVLSAYVDATGDDYAEYYNAEEYKALKADTAGASEGIGVNVINSTVDIGGNEYKIIRIIGVTPKSPADEAGVKVGDLIMWAGQGEDRELVDSLGYTQALSKLRGAAGTVANFTVLREKSDGSYDELAFSVERRKVESLSVYSAVSEVDPTVGIVKITGFDLTVPKQFSAAVDALIAKGCTDFVFDVRYNPGGDLASITAVLSYFLSEGDLIISTVSKDGTEEKTYAKPLSYESEDYKVCNVSKEDIGKYKNKIENIAVLCNESTASAAELFTAAMRDYGIATVVGEKTFGKGSMQSIISLESFGYTGALKFTTKMYFPPCGEGYDGIGITPHVTVSLSDKAKEYNVYELPQSLDDQLIAAIGQLNK